MMKPVTTIKLTIVAILFVFFCSEPIAAIDRPPCKTLVSVISTTPRGSFEFQHRSFASTFVTSILMFNAAQALRWGFTDSEFLTRAYGVTLPTDVALTLTTHAVSLSNIKPLKNFLEGKILGPALEPHMKIFTNAMLGVAYIHGSWAASGVEITPIKACLSIGLCAVVYPTLYFVKTRLFQKLPLQRDRKRIQRFRDNLRFGDAFKMLEADVVGAARLANIPDKEIELLSLTYIDNLLSDWPVEVETKRLGLLKISRIRDLIIKIESSSLLWKKRRARQDLLRFLIDLAHDNARPGLQEKAREALNLGAPFTIDSSLAFVDEVLRRARVQRAFVWGSSLLDQALAVGVAGGVGMYYVNDYAVRH